MEEYENVRPDIPGLVETEKSKKGKKKSNSSKKTLSLQNFLQDEPGVAASGESAGSDAMESHFAKLNLDEEELIVMESCHSFIHDMLKHMGPTNAMDPRLQQEINNFPPEAKKVIQKCGGYRNFILRSKDLAVVDKIVSARADLKHAQEMAFKEIYNNRSQNQQSKNENHQNSDVPKEVWNSKPKILNHSKSSGSIWGAQHPNEQGQVESFFTEPRANSVYYKSSASSPDVETARGHGAVGNGGTSNGNIQLPPGNIKELTALQKQLGQLHEHNLMLTEVNTDLKRRLAEKERICEDLHLLQSNFSSLESLYNNTKNELELCKSELQKHRTEMLALHTAGKVDGDKQIIFTLQNKLETERLKSLNLSKELEMHKNLNSSVGANLTGKPEDPRGGVAGGASFYSGPMSMSGSHGWDQPLSGAAMPGLDSDMLGLRSIFSADLSTAPAQGAGKMPPLPATGEAGSWLGLAQGHNTQHGSSFGLPAMPLLEDHTVPPPGISSAPSDPALYPPLFSMPPPGAVTSSAAAASLSPVTVPGGGGKQGPASGRQEQLVRKLAGMLPGADEETIKNCISELRARHGKLSGWPTSKIATHIIEMINDNNLG